MEAVVLRNRSLKKLGPLRGWRVGYQYDIRK